MTRRHTLVLGAWVYALALIATAPAALLDAALKDSSGGRLRLTEAQGTLWSGAGDIEVRDPARGVAYGMRVGWRSRPASLLRARLDFAIDVKEAAKPFPLSLCLSGIEVKDADITLPASALGIAVPKLAPLSLTGDLHLHVASLTLDRTHPAVRATLRWLIAGSTLTRVSPLGAYELQLGSAGNTLRASLRTLEGPLALNGEGSWANGTAPVFRVTARVAPEHERELAPLLRLIAVERGRGTFDLDSVALTRR
jgi:general secretion pathway protein N